MALLPGASPMASTFSTHTAGLIEAFCVTAGVVPNFLYEKIAFGLVWGKPYVYLARR